jgi:DNA polymerase alpha subunit B
MSTAELRGDLSESFGPTVASDEKLLSECTFFPTRFFTMRPSLTRRLGVNMCQMFGLSATDLQYKWEALSFSSTYSIKIFTMDSCAALKAKCQRDKAAEQAKLNKAPGRAPMPRNMDMAKGRVGGPAKFGSANLDGTLNVGLPPVKSSAGTPGFGDEKRNGIAGPSNVTFKGPATDEISRKKRACEL